MLGGPGLCAAPQAEGGAGRRRGALPRALAWGSGPHPAPLRTLRCVRVGGLEA